VVVIIGGGSSVSTTLLTNGNGVLSVNFGLQANVERLYELGSFSPYDTKTTYQRSFSMTVYGRKPDNSGGTQVRAIIASTTCVDASSESITFNPSACSGAVVGFTDTFFVTSYGYSKDTNSFGQESWSFTNKQVIPSYTGTIYMLRGIPTGQVVTGTDIMTNAQMGIVIDDAASRDSSNNYIEAESGSVSAGFPGIGNMEVTREVVVSSVGGSQGSSTAIDGKRGNASASIPMTLLSWDSIEYKSDSLAALTRPVFSGPAVSIAAKIEDSDFIDLDITSQHVLLVGAWDIIRFSWGSVVKQGLNAVTLDGGTLTSTEFVKARLFTDKDKLCIDTQNHEEDVHSLNMVYRCVVVKEDTGVYDYGAK